MTTNVPATRELVERLERGELTSVELTRQCLDRIARLDDRLGAFLHVDETAALECADSLDRRRREGQRVGRLAGLPVAVKDNLCDRRRPTTCASRMLKRFLSPYDAHVVERLRAEDAVLLGSTNLDEFAMGSSTENSAFRLTRNPWNPERTPGGSSGGSAVAVAAGMAPLAVGSDTGGSIRQPASFCGIVGLKPTYGRVSRYGLVAFASSLDQIGPMAPDVWGAARLLEVLAGPDPRDSTCVDRPVPEYSRLLEALPSRLTIGVAAEHFGEGLDAEVAATIEKALDVYRSLGAEIREISLPHTEYCVATYYLIASSEASSNLARYDGVHYGFRAESYSDLTEMYAATRGAGFGPEVKRRIMLGTYALSAGYYDAYYLKALKVRRLIRRDFEDAFQQVDVIAGPTTPTPPFGIGELVDDPLAMYLSDIYTIPANLCGLPAVSIPAGWTADGLPVGLHLVAPAFQEERLLQIAHAFERESADQRRLPPLDD